MNKYFIRISAISLLWSSLTFHTAAQGQPLLALTSKDGRPVGNANPLDRLFILNASSLNVSVTDGHGELYYSRPATTATAEFTVSGALGTHTVTLLDKNKKVVAVRQFSVDVKTSIDDGGHYASMFDLFHRSMQTDTGSVVWNGERYRYFVPWGLDHCHTMKGLKYFYGTGGDFVDLSRKAQRDDGMIWSFIEHMPNMDYFRTRDEWSGYTRKIGDKYFVRQPTENHPEYIFVNTLFQWWKASGDDAWMKNNLDAAVKALDYSVKDDARWSKRFQLLKRVYTIDSWDFAVEDEYLPDLGLTNTMIIDPKKSKFGVFFGDNTGYIAACHELSEMCARSGRNDDAKRFTARGEEMKKRLDDLAWNGKFYTHFIDEDPTVKRNLGVDEKSQLAQSNTYSLNRGITHSQSKSIIESYLDLKGHLPVGSPGEWYAIYPPFGRGFERHGAKWQYMNGGVGGHVAGELSRGAFENGYESYAIDILDRLDALGKKYDNKIYFSYTGSMPPPPPQPVYTPLNLQTLVNMDSWSRGDQNPMPWMTSKKPGDDFRSLPAGLQEFHGIRFSVIDAEKNNRKAAIAISRTKGFPSSAEVPVHATAGSVYFLHTSSKPTSENVSGAVSLVYADGSKITQYMIMGKQLTYWWFPQLHTDHSGIAWYGENAVSKGIGLSWYALDNPHPEKVIDKIVIHAAEDETIYTLFALTLADRAHYVPVKGPSYGGPDNWAAATAMAALIEGLAGIQDGAGSEAFRHPRISPRWQQTRSDSVRTTIRYAASGGYVSYIFRHNKAGKEIMLSLAGSGGAKDFHILLPEKAGKISVTENGAPIAFKISTIEQSSYADFTLQGLQAKELVVKY